MTTSRRGVLGFIGLSSLWLGGRWVYGHLTRPSLHRDYRTIAERLARLPQNREPLRGIGFAYLSSVEHRPTAEQIAEAWFPTDAERELVMMLERDELAQQVSARTLDDYRQGRVVSVHGWLLSETEARFAALVALIRRV